jgi:Tsp45I type II restriction enzyme
MQTDNISNTNTWLQMSIDYANQRNYLDELFQVYPTIPEGIRTIDKDLLQRVEVAFTRRENIELIKVLSELDLFPIKDSYVAYLKRDPSAIYRNPATIDRLCGRLYEMGLDKIFERSSEPKETNRQMGQRFRHWLNKKSLGVQPVKRDEFLATKENAVLDGGDEELKVFAREYLNYDHDKGLDLVARFNGKYVIGEAKFLTDFGGHQNAQFNDAIATLHAENVKAVKIAILDGVLYIEGDNGMHRLITTTLRDENIMSALVLREFLYQI